MSRIQFPQNGLAQWRQVAIHRRGAALVSGARVVKAQAMATKRCGEVAATLSPASSTPTIRIGEFVISPEGDPRILGHPHIRY